MWVRITIRWCILDTTLCNENCQWLAAGCWFSLGTPVSSTNKTDRHNITEILLKVALSTTILTLTLKRLKEKVHDINQCLLYIDEYGILQVALIFFLYLSFTNLNLTPSHTPPNPNCWYITLHVCSSIQSWSGGSTSKQINILHGSLVGCNYLPLRISTIMPVISPGGFLLSCHVWCYKR